MQERERLEKLLECDIDFNSYELYIWGTGNTSDLYQEGLKRLEDEGVIIKGYFDNNPSKWGQKYMGFSILSPEDAKDISNLMILVATPRPKVIRQIGFQLDLLKLKWLTLDAFAILLHNDEVMEVYDLLRDKRSKSVYAQLIKNRIEGSYPEEDYIDGYDRYFYGSVGDSDANEVFVDCGAFVGDSFEQFLWKKEGTFKKAILFEPDQDNLKALEHRLSRLKNEWRISDDKIQIFPYGVSDTDSIGYVERFDANNGLGSKILLEKSESATECKTVKIDSVVDESNLFIKADIESYEYKMILGASDTISRCKPKIAVCIYHNSVDFYSIPLLLKKLNPDYLFSVRHYSPNLSETILYAYCE